MPDSNPFGVPAFKSPGNPGGALVAPAPDPDPVRFPLFGKAPGGSSGAGATTSLIEDLAGAVAPRQGVPVPQPIEPAAPHDATHASSQAAFAALESAAVSEAKVSVLEAKFFKFVAGTAPGKPPSPLALTILAPSPVGILPDRFFMEKPQVFGVSIDPFEEVRRIQSDRDQKRFAEARATQLRQLGDFAADISPDEQLTLLQLLNTGRVRLLDQRAGIEVVRQERERTARILASAAPGDPFSSAPPAAPAAPDTLGMVKADLARDLFNLGVLSVANPTLPLADLATVLRAAGEELVPPQESSGGGADFGEVLMVYAPDP